MAQKIKRVRRRRIRSFASLGDFGDRFEHRQLVLIIAGIVAAIGLALVLFNYGARAYSNWQETHALKRATALLAENDYDGATRAAQLALDRHPDSLPAFQILAEATEKQNRIETVAWRAQIARLQPGNVESQLNLASAALRFSQLDTARKALERISPNERDRAAYHVVAGWLARAEGDESGLELHFAAAAKQEPNNALYQFNLAVLQIKSSDTATRDAARAALQRLSRNPQFRTGTLRAMLTDAIDRGDLAGADDIAQDLQMSTEVNFGDYLLCLDLYRKLDQKKFNALLEKVKPVAVRDPSDAAALMEWMNNNGLAPEVLKWMERLPPSLTTKPPPAVAVAEAFAEVKNWSRLRRWTRNGSWNDADYLRLAYQAFAARQMRQGSNDAEFDSLWRSAEHAAADQPARELNLARLAQRWNFPAEAEQLWLRVARNASARREALDALARIYRANNDLPNLYRTLQRVHENSPNDPAAAAAYARLALALEQNANEGHRLAKDAYDAAPNDPGCVVTYAFSLYGLGRTAEGIDILKKLPPAQLHDPHVSVYFAALLADENMFDAAREYTKAAHSGPLFAEERKLLDEVTARLPGAATPSPSPSSSTPAKAAMISPTPSVSPTPTTSPASTVTPAAPP